MVLSKSKYGFSGILIGMIALSIAVFSFWSGPFTVAPTAEPSIKEKILSFKETAIGTIKGESPHTEKFNIDKMITIAIPILSIIAIFLSIFSYINKEPIRVTISAGVIAVTAIIFQVIAAYTIILFCVLAVVAIVGAFSST